MKIRDIDPKVFDKPPGDPDPLTIVGEGFAPTSEVTIESPGVMWDVGTGKVSSDGTQIKMFVRAREQRPAIEPTPLLTVTVRPDKASSESVSAQFPFQWV